MKSPTSIPLACFICDSLYRLSRTHIFYLSSSLTGKTSRDKYFATCNSKSHSVIDCWSRKTHALNDNNTTLKTAMCVSVQQYGTADGDYEGAQVFLRLSNENKGNLAERCNASYASFTEIFG